MERKRSVSAAFLYLYSTSCLSISSGIYWVPASPAPRAGWDVCQGPPNVQKTKTLMVCFGLDSVLVAEGNFLRDMGEKF